MRTFMGGIVASGRFEYESDPLVSVRATGEPVVPQFAGIQASRLAGRYGEHRREERPRHSNALEVGRDRIVDALDVALRPVFAQLARVVGIRVVDRDARIFRGSV